MFSKLKRLLSRKTPSSSASDYKSQDNQKEQLHQSKTRKASNVLRKINQKINPHSKQREWSYSPSPEDCRPRVVSLLEDRSSTGFQRGVSSRIASGQENHLDSRDIRDMTPPLPDDYRLQLPRKRGERNGRSPARYVERFTRHVEERKRSRELLDRSRLSEHPDVQEFVAADIIHMKEEDAYKQYAPGMVVDSETLDLPIETGEASLSGSGRRQDTPVVAENYVYQLSDFEHTASGYFRPLPIPPLRFNNGGQEEDGDHHHQEARLSNANVEIDDTRATPTAESINECESLTMEHRNDAAPVDGCAALNMENAEDDAEVCRDQGSDVAQVQSPLDDLQAYIEEDDSESSHSVQKNTRIPGTIHSDANSSFYEIALNEVSHFSETTQKSLDSGDDETEMSVIKHPKAAASGLDEHHNHRSQLSTDSSNSGIRGSQEETANTTESEVSEIEQSEDKTVKVPSYDDLLRYIDTYREALDMFTGERDVAVKMNTALMKDVASLRTSYAEKEEELKNVREMLRRMFKMNADLQNMVKDTRKENMQLKGKLDSLGYREGIMRIQMEEMRTMQLTINNLRVPKAAQKEADPFWEENPWCLNN